MSKATLIQNDIKYIASRFGKIEIDLNKTITFPLGLLGLPDKTRFNVIEFPEQNFSNFKLFQSVEDENLSFIIYPVIDNLYTPSLIEANDLQECASQLNIERKDLLILLITTVNHQLNPENNNLKSTITVNVRAPLIIDTNKRIGKQYVFYHNKYEIKHVLNINNDNK